MKKEIRINYSYTKGEFLVQLFEDGKLYNWDLVPRSQDVQKIITDFYFPS